MYKLIYANDDFVVVSKPAFISVHCDENKTGFAAQLSKQLNCQLFVVHRLDKVTSGLMIFAKNAQAAAHFGKLFESRVIAKYYLAISGKKAKKKQGTVKGDMEKSRRMSWRLLKSVSNPAITRFVSKSYRQGMRVFLLKPETGKTHQLRVALKSIGAPIIGDPIYSTSANETKSSMNQSGSNISTNQQHANSGCVSAIKIKEKPATSTFDRCYLHAWQLYFNYNGQAFHFRQDPDQGPLFLNTDFSEALEQWPNLEDIQWSKS